MLQRHGRVPVMRPRLPTWDRLQPYLQRIDQARVYSNFGALASELEQRLCRHFSLPPGGVASAGSGLSAIVGAILGQAGRAAPTRPVAVVPAFTFVATAIAAEQCGYQPWLADVDGASWQMTPDDVLRHPRLDAVGLVVAVATLGRPVEQAPWREFVRRTGIPVVIDGAAAFDAIGDAPATYLGDVPVALSFHATKSFGVGEGGAVLASDVEVVARASRALNFGFQGSRDSQIASTNGKMSEYHAAVGLAELDDWNVKRDAMRQVAMAYREAFAALDCDAALHVAPDVAASYTVFAAPTGDAAERICAELEHDGLDFRFWYGRGLHEHTYFRDLARGPLPVTANLAPRLLGLPTAPDLGDDVIARVARCVALALDDQEARR